MLITRIAAVCFFFIFAAGNVQRSLAQDQGPSLPPAPSAPAVADTSGGHSESRPAATGARAASGSAPASKANSANTTPAGATNGAGTGGNVEKPAAPQYSWTGDFTLPTKPGTKGTFSFSVSASGGTGTGTTVKSTSGAMADCAIVPVPVQETPETPTGGKTTLVEYVTYYVWNKSHDKLMTVTVATKATSDLRKKAHTVDAARKYLERARYMLEKSEFGEARTLTLAAGNVLALAKETLTKAQKAVITVPDRQDTSPIEDAASAIQRAASYPDSVDKAKKTLEEIITKITPPPPSPRVSVMATPGAIAGPTGPVHSPRSGLKAIINGADLRKPDRVIHLGPGEWQPIGVSSTAYKPVLPVCLPPGACAPPGMVLSVCPAPQTAAEVDTPDDEYVIVGAAYENAKSPGGGGQ